MEERDDAKHIADALAKNIQDVFRQLRDSDIDADAKLEIEKELRAQVEEELKVRLQQTVRKKLLDTRRKKKLEEESKKEEWFQRFSPIFRAQHIVLFSTVILLIVTGLPLKFPESWWAEFLFGELGAFTFAKIVHRIAAAGLIAAAVFHAFYIVFFREGRKMFVDVLPRPGDIIDVLANLKYFLGFSRTPARFGRFSYIEKFDYWAVYWGTVIMVASGAALWFQEEFMRFLPKFIIDIFKEVHSDEALLATLALVIWHFYNVHLKPDRFPGTLLWWHGKISKEEMIHEHPLEYEEIIKQRLKEFEETNGSEGKGSGGE